MAKAQKGCKGNQRAGQRSHRREGVPVSRDLAVAFVHQGEKRKKIQRLKEIGSVTEIKRCPLGKPCTTGSVPSELLPVAWFLLTYRVSLLLMQLLALGTKRIIS